jgi:hypothetical protein
MRTLAGLASPVAGCDRRAPPMLNRRAYLWGAVGATVLPCARGQVAEADTVDRQVRWSFEVFNPTGDVLLDQSMWFYAPARETPVQSLESLQVSAPHVRETDELGHTIVKLSWPRIAPLARRTVSVTAQMAVHRQPRATPLPDPTPWLVEERYIEVRHPTVQAVAKALKRDTQQDTARAVYDWVRQNLQYAGYVSDDMGALAVLATRRGDCTEYAYLVVALARALGLPARMLGGYSLERSAVVRAEGYHNWAEVYFGGCWNLIDAQMERWLAPADRYLAFRIYRDARVNPIGLAHRYAITSPLQARY